MDKKQNGNPTRREFLKTSAVGGAFVSLRNRDKAEAEIRAHETAQQRGKQFIADSQTHIFWRREGHPNSSERGWWFLNQLDAFYKGTAPQGSVKDLTKARFLDLVLRQSETNVALLNCLALKGFYGGKHML